MIAELIVVLLLILLAYEPLMWGAKCIILRIVNAKKKLDKDATQIGNYVEGDQAGGDINKPCGCGTKGCTDIPELTPEQMAKGKKKK